MRSVSARVYNDDFKLKNHEHLNHDLPIDEVKKIASCLDTSAAYLMGEVDDDSSSKSTRIAVLGKIRAGIPLDAIQDNDVDDWEEISLDMARNGEHIALRIHGNSMSPKMSDGDIIIVRLQPNVESGDIAVVRVNGDDATVKLFKRTDEGIWLVGLNPEFRPIFYSAEECNSLPVEIIGKVVEQRIKW